MTECGQVTILKHIREHYGIRAETELEMIETDKGILIAKKVSTSPFYALSAKQTLLGYRAVPISFCANCWMISESGCR